MFADGQRMKEVFEKAKKERYAIIACNIANDVTAKAVIQAAQNKNSDLLVQISSGAAKFESGAAENMNQGEKILFNITKEMAEQYPDCMVGVNIDHCQPKYMDYLKFIIENQLASCVMIDASELPLDENIKVTKEIVDLAHAKGILVEGEIGRIKGAEDEVVSEETLYTKPEDALRFVKETDVDLFAAAVGTNHGVTKGKNVELRLDIMEETNKLLEENGLGHKGLVLHGASGLTPEQQKDAIARGVVKINKDTRYQMEFAAATQKFWEENKDAIVKPEDVSDEEYTPDKKRFDPRKWLKIAEEKIQAAAEELIDVAGSDGKTVS